MDELNRTNVTIPGRLFMRPTSAMGRLKSGLGLAIALCFCGAIIGAAFALIDLDRQKPVARPTEILGHATLVSASAEIFEPLQVSKTDRLATWELQIPASMNEFIDGRRLASIRPRVNPVVEFAMEAGRPEWRWAVENWRSRLEQLGTTPDVHADVVSELLALGFNVDANPSLPEPGIDHPKQLSASPYFQAVQATRSHGPTYEQIDVRIERRSGCSIEGMGTRPESCYVSVYWRLRGQPEMSAPLLKDVIAAMPTMIPTSVTPSTIDTLIKSAAEVRVRRVRVESGDRSGVQLRVESDESIDNEAIGRLNANGTIPLTSGGRRSDRTGHATRSSA